MQRYGTMLLFTEGQKNMLLKSIEKFDIIFIK